MLKEVLKPILGQINMVNAQSIAESRGIIVVEGKRCDSKGYDSLIRME